MFVIKNDLEGDALSSLLFSFTFEYDIRKLKANQKLLNFNGTHQVIVYADDINLWGQGIHTKSFITPL